MAKIPILFSAKIPEIADKIPIREKSRIPCIRKAFQPSSRRFITFKRACICSSLNIPHEIEKVDIAEVIRSSPKNAPCFTCAFFRRGAINRVAKERQCNKIAYAHHNDDAVETLLLNLLYSGQIGTFQPKTYLDRTKLTVIRPMIYLREAETIEAIQYHGMTPMKSDLFFCIIS